MARARGLAGRRPRRHLGQGSPRGGVDEIGRRQPGAVAEELGGDLRATRAHAPLADPLKVRGDLLVGDQARAGQVHGSRLRCGNQLGEARVDDAAIQRIDRRQDRGGIARLREPHRQVVADLHDLGVDGRPGGAIEVVHPGGDRDDTRGGPPALPRGHPRRARGGSRRDRGLYRGENLGKRLIRLPYGHVPSQRHRGAAARGG